MGKAGGTPSRRTPSLSKTVCQRKRETARLKKPTNVPEKASERREREAEERKTVISEIASCERRMEAVRQGCPTAIRGRKNVNTREE